MQVPLSEDQQRLKEHLKTLGTTDLQRLRQCFEYELTLKSSDNARVNEILDFIGVVLKEKLNNS